MKGGATTASKRQRETPVAAKRPPATERGARNLLAAVILVVLVLAAYLPALGNGFIWDDDDYVTRNVTLRTGDGLRWIWLEPGAVPQYYPLVHTSFWLEYHCWGLRPQGYHAVNILLHATSVVLLWLALRALSVPGAWLSAAIFAIHPVQVESVAWITERKNVLSGVFYLGALLAYLRFWPVSTTMPRPESQKRWGMYALALALFACALLSKTVTGSLPAAILVLLWWKRDRIEPQAVVMLVPFFALAGGLGVLTIWMEAHRVGATGADWALSAIERCLIAGRALWFYTAKLVWPFALTFIYPRWQVDQQSVWQWAFPLAAIGVVGGLYRLRGRLGRGPLVAVLFFGGTLLPALGFINVFPMRYTFVADHYQYLASIGVISLGVAVARHTWARWAPPALASVAAGVLLSLLGVLTWRQTLVYRDLETLWLDTLAKNPGCWMAHNNLGLYWQERGQLDEAMRHYNAALALKPDDVHAYGNLATALAAQGRRQEAFQQYEAALRLDPQYVEAHSNLGNLLAASGELDAAVAHYRTAISLRPGYADAHSNLANVLAGQGQIGEAIAHYQEALRIDPDYAVAHLNLGLVLAQQGHAADAITHLEAAVRLTPHDAEARAALDQLRAARQLGATTNQ